MTRLAASALVVLAGLPNLAASDSPMFRGSPEHPGVSSSSAPALTTVRWRFKTGGRVFSTPAVVGGIVYVGSADHHVYALRVSDGTQVWAFKAGLDVDSSPAVANGLVYFSSRDGNVYAVTADSGRLEWKFATGGEARFTARGIHGIQPSTETMPDPFDVFLSSPVVSGGRVYIGSGDHHVYALDAATGDKVWAFETGDVVHATPAVADDVVYVGSWDRNMYALDAASGRMIWTFQTGDDPKIHNQIGIASSAAIAGGVVLFGCRDGHFYAVDAKTGQLRWAEDNKGGWVIASPAVLDGVVYFPTSDGTQFKAIEIATGRLRWRTVNQAVSFSSPTLAGGYAYFGAQDGRVRALDVRDGTVRYGFQTGGNRANGAKYLNADGTIDYAAIYANQTLDGVFEGLGRMYSLGSVLSSPVIVDGVAYFGSTDGDVYAVG